jgi:purine-binding chemotaxis protein CheW
LPATVAVVPRAEAVLLGVVAHRDSLLPLLSLRALLGFPGSDKSGGREKVIVTPVGGILVGLVADRMRAIIRADPMLIEPTPSMLAARAGGESQIKSMFRGDGGRRLISILSPDQLFREDVMRRLGDAAGVVRNAATNDQETHAETVHFLVFQLGEEVFGLPIGAVDEVARAPDKITRIPNTPDFLEGVVNLRGEVLPVIDQRKRFGLPTDMRRGGPRLVVVRTERHRAGLLVDSVSEVLPSLPEAIEPAPELIGGTNHLVNGVVNLEATGRMVLLLDPDELLSQTERELLDRFATAATDQAEL